MTASNWVGDVAPMPGDGLVFSTGGEGFLVNNFPAGSLFNSIAVGPTLYSFGGSEVLLQAGISCSGTGRSTVVGFLIRLNASQIFTNSAAGSLLFQHQTINLNGNVLTFGVGAGEMGIADSAIFGSGAVVKTGPAELFFGGTNSYTGTTEVREGRLWMQTATALGSTNADTTVFEGATLAIAATPSITVLEPLTLAGTLRSDGGGTVSNVWAGPVTLASSSARIEVSGKSLLVDGTISGNGALTFSGSATLTLGQTKNTYTGGTTNFAANLVINAFQPQSPITIHNGSLGGTGTVGDATIARGTLAPGPGAGILLCSNLTFYGNRTSFAVELNGSVPGTGYDQVRVRGTAALSNAVLDASLNFTPAIGQSFVIIDNDGIDPVIGTFFGLAEGRIFAVGTSQFSISYQGGTGNDVVLLRTNASVTGVTRVWSGLGNNNLWTNSANWVGNVAPTPGDDLVFPPGPLNHAVVSNNFPAGTVFNSITLGRSDYSLVGSRITLNAGIIATNGFGQNSFGTPISLASNQTFTTTGAAVSAQVFLLGDLDLGTNTLTFAAAGSSGWQIGGVITGAGSLRQINTGFVTLYGSNTFSGPVAIQQGAMTLFHGHALGLTNGSTTVAEGARLRFAAPVLVPEPIVASGILVSAGLGTNTLVGPITLIGSEVVIGGSTTLVIDGVMSGGTGFHKRSNNVVILNAVNIYDGLTFLREGTLLVNGIQPLSTIVFQNGVLGGNGTVGPINVGGGSAKVISPGLSAGILTSGPVNMDAATAFMVELNGPAAAAYDRLNVQGGIVLGGCTLGTTLGFTPTVGQAFTIIENDLTDPVLDTFAGLPQGAYFTNNGAVFKINYSGGDGNDVVLTRVQAPSQLTGITALMNGLKEIQGIGASNATYTIQAATNLNPIIVWTSIGSITSSSDGNFSFTDTNAPLFPMRFYRALSP